jgi:hypothetical protein
VTRKVSDFEASVERIESPWTGSSR